MKTHLAEKQVELAIDISPGNAAQQNSSPELVLVRGGRESETTPAFAWLQSERSLYILGSFLILLQVADAYLTALGIYHFGMQAEGNLLLRGLMEHLGYIPALALAKGFAVVVIFGLGLMSRRVDWLPCAFLVLIGVYLSAAIIPWSYLLVRFAYLA